MDSADMQKVYVAAAVALASGAAAWCLARRRRGGEWAACVVTDLHRYAVKGLGPDELADCVLEAGGCVPGDRAWALLQREESKAFDPQAPQWVSKMKFYAACSAGEVLARVKTSFHDTTSTLVVRDKFSDTQLLEARIGEEEGRLKAERFFGELLVKMTNRVPTEVSIVRAAEGKPHQFGNTTSGVEASGDVRTIHLVNRETVRALSRAAGQEIDPMRFRANLLFDGLEAWAEFRWVGRRIAIGRDVQLRVIKRTVRCPATCIDLDRAVKGADVPALLQQHFPQHGPYLGVYAQVTKPGKIQQGDTIQFLG